MNPKDNLSLAAILTSVPAKAPEEACFRAACGRAYYAGFIRIRDHLDSTFNATFSPPSVHRAVSNYLRQTTLAEVLSVTSLLDQLKDMRVQADYHVGKQARKKFDKRKAALAVHLGNKLIAKIEAAIKSDPRLGIP